MYLWLQNREGGNNACDVSRALGEAAAIPNQFLTLVSECTLQAGNCSTLALKLILQSNQVCKIKHVWALICFQYRLIFQTVLQWDPTALWISHLSAARHPPPVPIDYFHIQTFQFDWSHQSEVDENGWSHTEINLCYSLVGRGGGTGS